MDAYLDKYDSLSDIVVYDFRLGDGGLGDCIKYFVHLLQLCITDNHKIYYLVNGLLIEKYLKLKHKRMYITNKELKLVKSEYKIRRPGSLYKSFSWQTITTPIQNVFIFSEEVKMNSKRLLSADVKKYSSIHLRLGDKYLETDKSYVRCKNDTRYYNEGKLYEYIEDNCEENIIFLSDNSSYKRKIKEKYNNIIITNSEVGHTSLTNTTNQQVLDAVTELYLMTNAEKIILASHLSGFPHVASKFKNTPLHLI